MKTKTILILATAVLLTTWGLSWHSPNQLPVVESTVLENKEQPSPNQQFVKVLDLTIDSNTLYKGIDFGFTYTSFTFEVPSEANFVNAYYRTNEKELFYLDSIPATDQPSDVRRSPFVIPNNPQQAFTFYSGGVHGQIRVYLFYAPLLEVDIKKRHGKKTHACEKPLLVKGSTWRSGLPDPIGTREKHEVAHCIVHHAASSNAKHNYLNVVRNIYLLHTQSNGWDDIGYNFVIAQDGSIFEGREHQKIDSTDNIKGAHYCGKNGGTMGVCMLGNFQETSPSDSAVQSLIHLLSWKCFKDDLNPKGSNNHPTASSPLLHSIAGHQDGCATACPGDSLYQILPTIRLKVDSIVSACKTSGVKTVSGLTSGISWYQKNSTQEVVFNYPVELKLNNLQVISVDGKTIRSKSLQTSSATTSINGLSPGFYSVVFRSSLNDVYTLKLLINE